MFRHLFRFAGGLPLVLLLLLPTEAGAQVEAAGSWKFTLAGSGTFGEGGSFTNIIGASRFTESGWEYGGDLFATVISGAGDTQTFGSFFGRVAYNFIGESLTVPFVKAGFGTSLGAGGGAVYDFGGGIKRFLSDSASLDFTLSYQGVRVSAGDEVYSSGNFAMFYGISIYIGGS